MMSKLKRTDDFSRAAQKDDLIGELLGRLAAAGVRCCHWKSNLHIRRWLGGEGDLDLLVNRRDAGEFFRTLADLGFKKTLVSPADEMPGILNFYGYDAQRDNFVHVHAHFQLTLGHDLTKNYRLPVENLLLETAVETEGIYTAAPEPELILYVLRMTLKNRLTETLARRAFGKSKAHHRAIIQELDFLEAKADEARLDEMMGAYFPTIDKKLFDACRGALRLPGAALKKEAARFRLERALSIYARAGKTAEILTFLVKRTSKIRQKARRRQASKKRFETGGALIAFVGGDGAGKTTCVNDVGGWLSKKFVVRRYHFGKPPKSLPTLVSGAAVKLATRFKPRVKIQRPPYEPSANGARNGFWHYLRWISTARDRYRLYKKMRRDAANGAIVICDRYPINGLRLMDGPKIPAHATPAKSINYLLSRIEKYYYRRIQPPDFMFVLRVDPMTAVERKTDEPPLHVFSRSREMWNFNWQQKRAQLLDASRPLEEVRAALRKAVWKIL